MCCACDGAYPNQRLWQVLDYIKLDRKLFDVLTDAGWNPQEHIGHNPTPPYGWYSNGVQFLKAGIPEVTEKVTAYKEIGDNRCLDKLWILWYTSPKCAMHLL